MNCPLDPIGAPVDPAAPDPTTMSHVSGRNNRLERAMKPRMLVCTWMAGAALVFAGDASAAIWRWGCMGPLGDSQIVSGRYQLLVLPARMPHGKLNDLIFLDDLTKDEKLLKDHDADIATYDADDGNSGLARQMTFTRSDQPGKLALTEKSSKLLAHRIVHGCRDEITDRFRKIYRFKPDDEPPRDVTLECIDHTLTTRGGRTCN
jgi:hypothetical protein